MSVFAAALKGVRAEAEAPKRGAFDKSRLGVRAKGAAAATLSQTRPKGLVKQRAETSNKHAFQAQLLP